MTRRPSGTETGDASGRPVHPARRKTSPPGSGATPVAPEIPVPASGEPVRWTAGLRVDLPEYVGEQVRETCYRMRCTQVALVLQLMAAFRDGRGRAVFSIRAEDLVPDRRKQPPRSP